MAVLLCWPAARGAEPATRSQTASLSGQEALEKYVAQQEANLTNQLRMADEKANSSAKAGDSLSKYLIVLGGAVVAVIFMRKVLPVFAAPFLDDDGPYMPVAVSARPDVPAVPDTHEEAFSGYLEKIIAQQKQSNSADPNSPLEQPGQDSKASAAAASALEPTLVAHVNALDQVMSVRAHFLDLNRASEPGTRKATLANLLEAVRGLRKGLRVSAAYPVGQMASALDGLLSQVATRDDYLTGSVLRTVAGAIDLLPSLCGPAIRSDLASNPPITLLAVDDDPVIRHALSCALKRVWARPDLAKDGQEGLAMVEARAYDLVFLDIEMPGMDGFELCYKIHATPLNAVTPVVFVTSHNDFASRARSSLAGGHEFLGKPFLSAELTLKALTLALMRRLQAMPRAAASASKGAEKPAIVDTPKPKQPLLQPT